MGWVRQDEVFDSQFNMALKKLERIHKLLMQAHQARVDDDHTTWKTCLDAINCELAPYFDDKDPVKELKESRANVTKLLMDYLEWKTRGNNAQFNHLRQKKELQLEDALDRYQLKLGVVMKNHNLELTGKDDLSLIMEKGQY